MGRVTRADHGGGGVVVAAADAADGLDVGVAERSRRL